MQSTAKILAGAAGLTTAFVAGGFAKDKFNQVNTKYLVCTMLLDRHQVKFEKAVPLLPKESLAEIAKTKVGRRSQL